MIFSINLTLCVSNSCPLVPLLGSSLIPYGLPCLRELFRFLISLTNPHDRHNTDAMMHMGLQLLTVALESGHIANYQSLLVLVKDELCRHLFQVQRCVCSFSWQSEHVLEGGERSAEHRVTFGSKRHVNCVGMVE